MKGVARILRAVVVLSQVFCADLAAVEGLVALPDFISEGSLALRAHDLRAVVGKSLVPLLSRMLELLSFWAVEFVAVLPAHAPLMPAVFPAPVLLLARVILVVVDPLRVCRRFAVFEGLGVSVIVIDSGGESHVVEGLPELGGALGELGGGAEGPLDDVSVGVLDLVVDGAEGAREPLVVVHRVHHSPLVADWHRIDWFGVGFLLVGLPSEGGRVAVLARLVLYHVLLVLALGGLAGQLAGERGMRRLSVVGGRGYDH